MALINGREYQHATITLQARIPGAGSFEFEKFRALNYVSRANKQATHDKRGKIDGYTIMAQETEGNLRTRKSEMERLRQFVRQLRPLLGLGEIEFSFSVTYGATLKSMVTDVLPLVMFQEDARASEDNQEALEVDVPLFIMDVTDEQGRGFINYDRPSDD